MCQFFSFVTKGSKKYYFDWEQRKILLESNPKGYKPDSHTSICGFHGLNDDKVNKYEFNPLTRKFIVDQINIKDNQALAKKWVKKLNFKTIIEPLVIHDIIHPFKINSPKITDVHITLLRNWASVWASVWDSASDSASASVWASVSASVWDSVWASVWDSVWDSVRASVWASVRASIWTSVWAYTSSFFDIDKWKYINHKPGENPFQAGIDLWSMGIIPSFDGKKWRLHTKNGIAWEGVV